jgi:hypothetical protein
MPLSDTHPSIRARMDAAYRSMSPAEKITKMLALTSTTHALALSGIRKEYPDETPREHRMRLCSRYMDRDLMIAAFGWDPEQHR